MHHTYRVAQLLHFAMVVVIFEDAAVCAYEQASVAKVIERSYVGGHDAAGVFFPVYGHTFVPYVYEAAGGASSSPLVSHAESRRRHES